MEQMGTSFNKEQDVAVTQGQVSNTRNTEIADDLATNQQYAREQKSIQLNFEVIWTW